MNESTIICPLLMVGNPMGAATGAAECKGARCAWWDGRYCAMLTIAQSLNGLNENGIIVWPEKEDA